jgi:hypothetical protein
MRHASLRLFQRSLPSGLPPSGRASFVALYRGRRHAFADYGMACPRLLWVRLSGGSLHARYLRFACFQDEVRVIRVL